MFDLMACEGCLYGEPVFCWFSGGKNKEQTVEAGNKEGEKER